MSGVLYDLSHKLLKLLCTTTVYYTSGIVPSRATNSLLTSSVLLYNALNCHYGHGFMLRVFITARSIYASAVLGIVILSVCPSLCQMRAL